MLAKQENTEVFVLIDEYDKPIYLIGIGFNAKEKNVSGLCWEIIRQ